MFAQRFSESFKIKDRSLETAALLLNKWRCPLTDVAARYAAPDRDNFDIYLPEWLARHNKTIFGGLFFFGLLLVSARRFF